MHAKTGGGALLALGFVILLPAEVHSAAHVWTGAVSAAWSNPGNWTGGSPAGDAAAELIFGAGTVRFDSTNDLAGATPVTTLRFTGGAHVLSAAAGSSLTLAGGAFVSFGASARLDIPLALTGGLLHDLSVVGTGRLTIAAPISGGAADTLRANGGGTVVLEAANTYSGATIVGAGGGSPEGSSLIVNGGLGASAVTVFAGRLSGAGVVGPLSLEGGSLLGSGPGSVRPGPETQAGTLGVQGDAHLRVGEAGNVVSFRLNGPADHDALHATGTVFLDARAGPPTPTRPTLALSLGFVPAIGQSFTLVQSDTGITGTFENGGDGAIFDSGCLSFRINYTATTVTVTRAAGAYEPFARFYTVPACRVVDTRGSAGPTGGPALAAGDVRVFPIAGACQIPATAKALSANVTAVSVVANGDLRVFPAGTPPPLASVLNFGAGQTRANNLVAGWACSPDKSLAIQNESTGAVHVILDVNGYFE